MRRRLKDRKGNGMIRDEHAIAILHKLDSSAYRVQSEQGRLERYMRCKVSWGVGLVCS